MRNSTDLFSSIDTGYVSRWDLATISPAKGKSKRMFNIGDNPDETIRRLYTSPVHYLSELLQVRTSSRLSDCLAIIGTEWTKPDNGDDVEDSKLENVGELPYDPSDIFGSREFDRNTHSPPLPIVLTPAPFPGVDYRMERFMHKMQGPKWVVWELYFDFSQDWWFPTALPNEVKVGSTMVDGEFRAL